MNWRWGIGGQQFANFKLFESRLAQPRHRTVNMVSLDWTQNRATPTAQTLQKTGHANLRVCLRPLKRSSSTLVAMAGRLFAIYPSKLPHSNGRIKTAGNQNLSLHTARQGGYRAGVPR